jgi:subtilisin family serine protease
VRPHRLADHGATRRFRGTSLLTLLVTSALAFTVAGTTAGTTAAGDSEIAHPHEAIPGQFVVGFHEHSSPSVQHRAVAAAGGTIEDRLESIDAAVVSAKKTGDGEVAAKLARAQAVDFVEPNYVVRSSRLPNDPAFHLQWGLRDRAKKRRAARADIHAAGAWNMTTGGRVTVAVVDTGIDYTHPDLARNVWNNPAEVPNGVDDDHNGFVDDLHGVDFANGDADPVDDSGHGTHVAGIIGARGDNRRGTTGVNWKVRLMAVKFLDPNGEGDTAGAAQAINYAVAEGAQVINASWAVSVQSQAVFEAIANAARHGVLVVAAAGNEGKSSSTSPDFPAAYDLPNVISVAATDERDRLADFSNYGPRIDLAAPGDSIYSTVPARVNATGYDYYSGTSMATPFVTGAAALYLARYPGSTVAQLRRALLRTVDRLPSLKHRTRTGGRLDVRRALRAGRRAAKRAYSP